MADFNAGSIEGTLGLDSSPFKAGLAEARQQAADFEGKKISPELGLSDGEFKAKKDVAETELTAFDHKKVTAKADLDIGEAITKYEILKRLLDFGGLGKGVTSVGLMTSKIFALTGGVLGLISVLGPAGVAVSGFAGASIAAYGGIAIALGLFAGAAKSAFGEIEKANKAGVTLTGWAGRAQSALKSMSSAWNSLVGSVKPQMFQLFQTTFSGIAYILPKLAPLLRATTVGMQGLVTSVLQIAKTPVFAQFLHQLSAFMGGFLAHAGPVIYGLLVGFMNIFMALEPLMKIIGSGIAAAVHQFDIFSASMKRGGITPFVTEVKRDIPLVMGLLGSLFSGIRNLLGQLAPLAGPTIAFIETLVQTIGHLHLAPLARGFGDVFNALRPLLPVLGQLLNVILGPLGHFLSALAQDALVPLAHSLSTELVPAFAALHTILHALIAPAAAFAASIANLLNPTGVHLFTTLLVGLSGIVVQLAPSLSALAVALESLVDDAINAIIPLLPTLIAGLSGVVHVLVPVINFLAKILANRGVVDVILAMVAAFKAYQLVMWLANSATRAAEIAMAIFNAVMDANPIMLVVIALAGLAAGLIYAYKHSETFRNIVNGAFHAVESVAKAVFGWLSSAVSNTIDFIRSHWQLLLAILTGPVGAALIFLIGHWHQIVQGFQNMISSVQSAVKTGLDNVFGWFAALPGRIAGLAGAMLSAGKSLMSSIFQGLESAASSVGGFASNIAGSIWGALKGVLNGVLPHSLHIPIPHAPDINVPLFPYLAKGGVSRGPTPAVIGDNPGGREAVVPLDQYDLPRKGDMDALASRSAADNSRIISLLALIAGHLGRSEGLDAQELADALAPALDRHSKATMKTLIQVARAQ